MSTLADLRTRFYSRFDESSQNYLSAAQANSLINEGASHLHNWLVSEGENYTWLETVLPLVTGQTDYPLPDNFVKMLKVFASAPAPSTRLWPLPRIMPQEYRGPGVSHFSDNWICNLPRPQGYMIVGQTLRILPVPGTPTGNITYWWAPQFEPLVLDTDTTPLSMFLGSEEFIVNHAVIGARLQEESDTSALERRQAQIQAMLQQVIINRDMGQHAHVVDSERPRW